MKFLERPIQFAVCFTTLLSPVSASLHAQVSDASGVQRQAVASTDGARGSSVRADRQLVRALRATTADKTTAAEEPVVLSPWDGTAESLYRSPEVGQEAEYVELFVLPADRGVINEVTACFEFQVPIQDFTYEVLVFRASGGTPGALIDFVELTLAGTAQDFICIRGEVDIPVDQRRVFIGVFLPDVGDTFIGVDTNGPTTSPGFYRFAPNDPFVQMPDQLYFDYRNLALDAVFTPDDGGPVGETCPAVACVADQDTACILDGRFSIEADFRDQNGGSGTMQAGQNITSDTAYLHFPGQPENVEVVGKLVNACATATPRFWFFGAGLTDQEITLRVCDTQAGVQKTYVNELKVRFAPIQDVEAFSTCP